LESDADSPPERGEFELPVPICEQSDDTIRLRFATSRRTAKRYWPAGAFLGRFRVAGSEPHAQPLRGRLASDQMSDTSRARLSCSGAGRDRRSQLAALVTGIGNSNLRRPETIRMSKLACQCFSIGASSGKDKPIRAENDDEQIRGVREQI
jgi:hypothetical protein